MPARPGVPELFDISPLVSRRIGVFPGDTPFSRDELMWIASGDPLDLSRISTTVHVGAHADAPSHYRLGGAAIHERPLELYFGDCQVIDAAVGRGQRIRPADLAAAVEAPRVLLRTGTFPDPDRWNQDFASLSAELVAFLHDRGVRLVGIDTPSIDLQPDKALESHNAVADRDMAVLEGLALAAVPPGRYTLAAFPLKLEGADAAPVRAVLIRNAGSDVD
ncbi:MAG: cyclase family protein [Planctomycetes bacterium]|nr:cyclase family protein [Planctomycetota bacterium]MBL7007699.1 cyclase family protein [Planctomycetota bacterium]